MSSLIFVDCEGDYCCPCPGFVGQGLTEIGAVESQTRKTFYGLPDTSKPEIDKWYSTFVEFEEWLKQFPPHYVFVTDNVAYDWQWINYHFHHLLGRNPFGFSARRIGDFYAGLTGDFYNSNKWKKLRITKHDHNPVNDALGNLEAWERMVKGERV